MPRDDMPLGAEVLRSTLDHVAVGVAVLGPVDDGADFVYVYVNPAFQALKSRIPMLGRTYTEVWPELTDRFVAAFRGVLETGEPWTEQDLAVDIEREPGLMAAEHFALRTTRLDVADGPFLLCELPGTTAEVEALQRAERELETTWLLLQASQAFTKSAELGEVLRELAEVLLRSTSHTRSFVFLWDEGNRDLTHAASAGVNAFPPGRKFSFDSLSVQTQRSITQRRTIVVDFDAQAEPQRGRALAAQQSHIMLSVPVVWQDRLVAMLGVDDPGERREFTDREIQLVEGIAAQEAVAIENARLFDERAESLRQLGDSQRKLALHLEQTLLGVIEWDTEFRIREWNPAAEAIFGYSREEAVGKSAAELIVPESARSEVESLHSALLGQRGGLFSTNENVTKDDKAIVCEWVNTPLTDDEGAVVGVMSLARDITQRIQAEESRRAAETQYRTIFESEPECVKLLDREGRLLEMNPAGLEMIQATLDQVRGEKVIGLVAEEDQDAFNEMVEAVFQGETRHLVFDMIGLGGLRLTLETTSAPLMDTAPRGGVKALLGVSRDITERERNEQAVLESRDRLARVVAEVTEAMGRIVEARDPYTQGHQARVTKLSSAIAAEMGLPEQDVKAVELAAAVHDIGKLGVPSEILARPGELSDAEFALIMSHPQSGYDILKDIEFPWSVAQVALQHHERMDGSGYPNGLHGEEIDILARIVAVADVVEAMASHRPYRGALGLEAAIAEIQSKPQLYDSEVVSALLRLHDVGHIEL